MNRLIVIPILLQFSLLQSQEWSRMSLKLQFEYSSGEEGKVIELTFRADPEIRSYMTSRNLKFSEYFGRYYRCRLNWSEAIALSHQNGFEYFESGFGRPAVLNDTMVSVNKIKAIHMGNAPLERPYKGKGVVLGFIDTGIDFLHPDFRDSMGRTRILYIWDQAADTLIHSRIPSWGYGQVWDSAAINSGICNHDDDVLSHGTNVAGIAAGNGLALNHYSGVAPESDMIAVASDFSSTNWLQTVADGVEFIFDRAEELGKPCVVNISAGDYLGSHDGTDLAALRIDNMIKAREGRAVVAAAGNSGNLFYHLSYTVINDTAFTWFQYNPGSVIGIGSVYFQLWADSSEFSQVQFAIGANKNSPSFQFRGRTAFDHIGNRLNKIYSDSIYVGNNVLSYVQTYAELQGDKYFMEVLLPKPDSSSYLYSFMTHGSGKFDIWSDSWLGISHMVKSPLPSVQQNPEIAYYRPPDTLKTLVSSFACLPSVITVANYINRNSYVDYDTITQTFNVVPGKRADNSSLGPNRRNYQKPDIAATGDFTITPNRLASIPLHIANGQSDRIAKGGMHKRNGGTSMAAPVVAGILALLLEQCPSTDFQTLRNWLINNVITDSLTGFNLPDYSYGYGKANALDAFLPQIYTPSVMPGNDLKVCNGSELMLSGPPGMKWYAWSTGDSLNSILIDSTLNLQLITADSSGCTGRSDTVKIVQVDLPPKPIVTMKAGNTLESTNAVGYQWYLNGSLIPGANSRQLTAGQSGNYTVEITDSNHCHATSDPFEYISGVGTGSPQTELKVYPNPSLNGYFNFDMADYRESDQEFTFEVSNGWGYRVLYGKGRNRSSVDLSAFGKGIYIYTVYREREFVGTGKLIYP